MVFVAYEYECAFVLHIRVFLQQYAVVCLTWFHTDAGTVGKYINAYVNQTVRLATEPYTQSV